MPWVRMVPEDEAEGDLKEAYDRIRGQRGAVANVVKISSLLPKVMERGMDFYMALMFGRHNLPRAARELVAVEVSRVNQCSYCVHHHAAALERVTKDKALVEAAMAGKPHPAITAKDQAMLAYARKLTETPGKVEAKDVEALRLAGFDDEAIVAINHVTGYFNMMNRIVSGLGVELEADKGADPKYKY
jgi:uncharacterized peroxidase-related enzyme